MPEPSENEIRPELQPRPEDVGYDLDRALASCVVVHTRVPEDAFTASVLGTERAGNGVVIGEDRLVLTVNYLVTEAEQVWLVGGDGRVAPGHVVGTDAASGLGLVQAHRPLGAPALTLGDSDALKVGDPAVVAGCGGRARAVKTRVVARQEFAGYWEYVLDEAIFTAPAHPNWGGTALIGTDGRLAGVGSLYIQQMREPGGATEGNMVIPINLLPPVLGDLMRFGAVRRPARPWLGMYTTEAEGKLVVVGLAREGPAAKAGIEIGDVVLEAVGAPPRNLADLFRRVWAAGEAGATVPLTLMRDGKLIRVAVVSADRGDFLRGPQVH